MRVSAAETPEYAKKQMKIVIAMLQGMERWGFRASTTAEREEVLGHENTLGKIPFLFVLHNHVSPKPEPASLFPNPRWDTQWPYYL